MLWIVSARLTAIAIVKLFYQSASFDELLTPYSLSVRSGRASGRFSGITILIRISLPCAFQSAGLAVSLLCLVPATLLAQQSEAQAASVAAVTDPAGQAPNAAAPVAKRFDILEYNVTGNTVLDERSISAAVGDYLGSGRTTEDVDKARASLERAYRDRGFKTVSVSIPKQNVREGVVRLQVNEGRVGHLNVVGSQFHSLERIREAAPSLAEGEVPNFNLIQQELAGLNTQSGRRVTPSMRPGANPGTVDIDLVVKDELPLHGSLELNNRHSQDTSSLRTSATLSYDNLWQRGHSATVSYQTAPQNTDDARVFFGSYLARFGPSPFSLSVNALKSDSDVATVGGISVVGQGKSFGVRGMLDLAGSENFYPRLSFGVDYKRFNTIVGLETGDFETPLEYYPFTLSYSALYRGESSITQGDFSVIVATSQLGSSSAELDASGLGVSGKMFYVRENLSHTHDLPFGTSVFVRLSGQMTDRPLVSNEQFSAGGMDTVRGYLESSALGDYGFGGTLEIRSPSLGEKLVLGESAPLFQDFIFLVFLDGAKLWLRNPGAEVAPQSSLLSTGVGLNIKFLDHIDSTLVWAEPILSQASNKAGSSRFLFRVSAYF